MKKYKIACYKYGSINDYDVIIISAKNFDHLCLMAGEFCRKSSFYKEWTFIGETIDV